MKKNQDKQNSKRRNQIRIIGGSLRGRKITFPDSLGLRPTPDRIKETLFNWLNPVIKGATCLDLFAGSGALSFEAISRGAATVVALEKAPQVSLAIQQQVFAFKAERLIVQNTDSQIYLKANPEDHLSPDSHYFPPFDIVFVDPPYGSHLLLPSFILLSTGPWVKAGTLIYAGTDHPISIEDLPSGWKILRQQKAGIVHFYLLEV